MTEQERLGDKASSIRTQFPASVMGGDACVVITANALGDWGLSSNIADQKWLMDLLLRAAAKLGEQP